MGVQMRRELDRARPIRPRPAQDHEAREGEHVREHVPEVRRREHAEDVPDEEDEQDVDDHVHGHRVPGHVVAVQPAELLYGHPRPRDPVERAPAVRGCRVHRDDEARDETHDEEIRERRRADDQVHRPDVVVGTDELRRAAADEADRQHDVDDHREERRRAQRALRITGGVLVLGGEGRTDVHPPGRPAHQPEPDERELESAPRRIGRLDRIVEVRAVEAAVDERQDHHHEERNHEQRAGEVAERDADADSADVEQPHGEDEPDRDELRETRP